MNSLFALLLVAFAGLLALANAQQGIVAKRCNLFDANGYPTAEAMAKHGTFLLGIQQPGWIHYLNNTVMHNHIPGQTTFEDYSNSGIYQGNGFEFTGTGCAMTHHQIIKRAPKVFVYGKWIDEVFDDQRASPPYPGAGHVPLLNAYGIRAIEPITFEYAAVATLKIRARALSDVTYIGSYNFELPDGSEIPVIDEVITITPKTLALLQQGIFTGKESYYSLNIYQGVHNGFVDWGYIFRKEYECAGATGDLADACECYQRALNGQLTLENDPLAAAAGQYHEVYVCRLDGASAKHEITWPGDALSHASYALAYNGHSSFNGQPLRYVKGMPVTEEQHNAAFFGTEDQE